MRVLLVESESEDALFLKDVLAEIESGQYWGKWVHIEILHAPTWSDAAAILDNETPDVILLDLDLADSQGIDTFRGAQARSQEVPMILLVGPEDGELAARMVRDGAQDFLIKKEVDCAPLAHAMRNAVERHRLLMAARAAATTDPLTGLLTRSGFLACADRDRKLAERLGRRLMVMIAEPRSLSEITSAHGEHRRDLALVEAADHLRTLVGPTDVLGRVGATRFGLTVFDTDLESVEDVWARIHGSAAGLRILIGAAVFDGNRPAPLEALLDLAAMDLAPGALTMRR